MFSIPALSTWANQGALVDRKGVTDNRKVKNEAWYVAPDNAKLWQYTTEDISTTFPEAAKAWTAANYACSLQASKAGLRCSG